MNVVHYADNLSVLSTIPDSSIDLIYIDPPFNTGKVQKHLRLQTRQGEDGDRRGFGGRKYKSEIVSETSFHDAFVDYEAFLRPRLEHAHRVLKETGSFYFHIDYREAHYCKVFLDTLFGRNSFINELIWAYDYGARSKKRWPAKHDTSLFYAKDPKQYFFDIDAVERIPYMAPGLVGPEKAERGKTPTDVWWHTIVPTNGKERLGYATQKPLGIVRRAISASCPYGGTVLDFFAGSGTTGAAALEHGCQFILIDNNIEAVTTMKHRFENRDDVQFV